ncbi:hypothetical protein MYX76_14870 [Desulfobacterota bacterium AH_259_B03_O07]|nr:hypothetical protein [Desulfobacterota bacterium AH_259_B03_O07]
MNQINMDFERKVLLKEYEKVSQEIILYISTSDKVIGIGILILGFGFAYGIKENLEEILLMIPIAVFGVYFYALYLLTCLFSLAGYRKSLEEKINSLVGNKILLWDSEIWHKYLYGFTVIILNIILCILLLFTILISLVIAFESYGLKGLIILLIINLFFIACLVEAVRRMKTSFKKVYQHSKAAIK